MSDEKKSEKKHEDSKESAFKAVLSDVYLFRDSLTAINELVNEAIFKIKADGIYLTATDPTMVALVDYKFLSSAFESYVVHEAEDIGLNIENLLAVLKRAKSEEKVTLDFAKGANKLLVTINGASTRKFTIPVLDIEKGEVPEMSLEFTATVEVKTNVLIDGIEDASIVTDTVILGANANEFTMRAEGDLSKVEIILEKGSPDLIGIEAKTSVASKFSLEYLKKIVKGAKIADTAKIQLGNDYPLKVTFRAVDNLQISYVLAPRVED
ncbi:DNA polymerase sliding clamp [uncultured archaeon]|nr:DNA polymerase sliding clamp [uncultured archaeon]